MCSAAFLSGDPYEKKFQCRIFHTKSTILQHVFHMRFLVAIAYALDGAET